MKIKKRLKLNTWISLLAIALIFAALVWISREIYRTDLNVYLSDEMRKVAYERVFLRDDYLLNKSAKTKNLWYVQTENLRVLLNSASEKFANIEDKELLQEIRKNFDATFVSFSKILKGSKQKEPAYKKTLFIAEAEPVLIHRVFQNAYRLNHNIVSLYESSRKAARTARDSGMIIVIIFLAGNILAIIINSNFISRAVAKRITLIDDGLKIIEAGNLNYHIDARGNDELSDLARACNEMVSKLKAYQEYSENIINTVREPLIALDQDLRVVKVSRSFYDFFNVKPEDTVGKLIYDLGDKQWDIPKLRELLETILPQKTSFDNYEVEHEFPNIGRRVMLLNARQIQQVSGRERIILLAIEDITEHKRLENLLMESEELYKSIFKTASDGIILLEKRDGKITHANPAVEKMLGYSIKDCIGNKLQDIGFELDFGDFQTIIQELNKNGIINYVNVPVKTKSGQPINADIYLVNKTTVIQCNIRDVTDRVRAEEALMNSEANFRRSLEDSPLGMRVATATGETVFANKALLDLYGYANVGELNNIPLKERYTPQSYAEFQTRKEAREGGDFGPSVYEINIVMKNSEIRHLQVLRKEVLWNGANKFLVIYQDITERKLAEDDLKKSLAEKEVLLQEVHHRVKNNLMIIIGLIKMQGTKANIELFNPLLLELEGRVRAMALVHESLHKSADLAHIDLQNYIETMRTHICAQFGGERDIRFTVQAAGVDVGLDIAVPCGLVLNELIVNAFKHAFPAGKPGSGAGSCEISVAVVREGGNLKMTVADNGVGLPVGVNWKNPGTLGLRLVKMLSQQIGASLEMERSAGTVFSLRFPVAAP